MGAEGFPRGRPAPHDCVFSSDRGARRSPRDVKERNLAGLRTLPGFRFVEADVARDPMPLDGVEAVIHLAAKAGVRPSLEDPGAYMEANVTATARLIDAARRRGLTRIVFGSSSSVYGNSTPAPFAEDKPA